MPLPDSTDWLGFCRRAAGAARDAVHAYANTAERGVRDRPRRGRRHRLRDRPRGGGRDLPRRSRRSASRSSPSPRSAARSRSPGGGETRIVIDPVDGSLNAKRGLPFACVSIAIASGPRMADVEVGCVARARPAALGGRRAAPRARLVGGEGRGRLPRRRAPAGASARAARGARARDRAPGARGRRGRRDRVGGRPPAAGARLGGDDALPRGGRPARRDALAAPDPLGGRRGRRSSS